MRVPFRCIHQSAPVSRSAQAVALLALLLIAIRLVAGFVCSTCFNEIERPDTRSFHLHGGGDLDPCHHGRATAHPLDDPAVVLPDVPQLFLVVSFLAVAVPLIVPFRGRFLIAATGRGPPLTSA
ncbi:MAG: hypothetical protein DYH03_08500 [Nitrospira sp. NTP1]|nr:hypothetical protein [Nitrospira sp. NTP1]